MQVRPVAHLRESVRLFRAHPVLSSALGLSLVVSIAAVCCGLGVVAAPWFGCELYAFQVQAETGARPPRTRAWLSAGAFILLAALLSVASAAISGLSLASAPVDETRTSAFEVFDPARGALSFGGALLALFFIMPFTYAPRILVDRGGSLGASALESARFFVRDGALAHVGLVLLSHGIQTIPIGLAILGALVFADASAVPLAVLIASPLLAVSVPMGQGVVTCAWVARRDRWTPPGPMRPNGVPSRLLVACVVALLLVPPLALAATSFALVAPANVRRGAAPEGETLVDETLASRDARTIAVPTTALDIAIEGARVVVAASDGGGAGALPRRDTAPVERVRVVRVRDTYTIELTTSNGIYVARVDRAGVRLDDDLAARLADRVPAWHLLALAFSLLLTPLLLTRALVALAELRALAMRAEADTPNETLTHARRDTERLTWLVVALLLPLSAAALTAAIFALGDAG